MNIVARVSVIALFIASVFMLPVEVAQNVLGVQDNRIAQVNTLDGERLSLPEDTNDTLTAPDAPQRVRQRADTTPQDRTRPHRTDSRRRSDTTESRQTPKPFGRRVIDAVQNRLNIGTDSTTVDETTQEETQRLHKAFQERVRQHRLDALDEQERRHQAFQQRIQAIGDERKREIVARVCSQFDTVNDRTSTHLTAVLGRLDEIRGKMDDRLAKAADAGVAVESCRAEIDTMFAAVATARDAVVAQAGRTYTCELSASTTDETVGQQVRTISQGLRADLASTRDQVRGVRQAGHDAINCLQSVRGVDEVE